jgi:IgA Peptidase M64.
MIYVKNNFSLICCLLAFFIISCDKDEQISYKKESAENCYVTFLGELNDNEDTKAYWEDINRKGGASFKWATTQSHSANMVSSIYNGSSFVQWSNANYYSLNTVTPQSSNPKIADISSITTIGENSVSVGDKLFCFAPIETQLNKNNTTVSASSSSIDINVKMPNVFTQSASGKLEEFKPYSYVYSLSEISENNMDASNNEKIIKASDSKFKTLSSVLRLNVLNESSEEYIIKSVSMTPYKLNGGSKDVINIFPDRVNLSVKEGNISISEPSDKSGFYSTITTNLSGSEKITTNGVSSYYMFLLPNDNVNAMLDVNLEFKVVATKVSDGMDYAFTTIKNLEKLGSTTKEKRFRPGYIYTMNLTLNSDNISKYHYAHGEYKVYMESKKANPIKLFITGDGYLAKDFGYGGKFDSNADEGIEEIFSIEPYKSYREYFTVYKLAFYSNQEGVSYGNGESVDTYFNVMIDTYGGVSMRCKNNDYSNVYSSIKNAMADSKLNGKAITVTDNDLSVGGCIILVNKDVYAGTCYREIFKPKRFVAMVPVSRNFVKLKKFGNILIHEFGGHGFGKFADEYFIANNSVYRDDLKQYFNYHAEGIYLNVDVYGDEKSVPWSDLIGKEGYEHVKVYEGAFNYQFGIYRSEEFSCMRDSRKYFNSQCRKVIVQKIKEAAGEEFNLDDFIAKDIQKTDNTVNN